MASGEILAAIVTGSSIALPVRGGVPLLAAIVRSLAGHCSTGVETSPFETIEQRGNLRPHFADHAFRSRLDTHIDITWGADARRAAALQKAEANILAATCTWDVDA
jgi:hypothetical protein